MGAILAGLEGSAASMASFAYHFFAFLENTQLHFLQNLIAADQARPLLPQLGQPFFFAFHVPISFLFRPGFNGRRLP